MIDKLVDALIFIMPAYFANAAPVLFRTGKSKTPMDMKLKFYDSRRILGEGKTWAGFFVGIITGTLIGTLIWIIGLQRIYSLETHILVSFLLSTGTMVGDAFGSFIKRRISIRRGKPFPLLDQLGFLVFALLFAYNYLPSFMDAYILSLLIVITFFVHYFANVIAYKIKLKRVPW